MTAVPAEHHWVEPAFRNVAIVYREPSARWLLSTVASELAPDPAAWHDIGDVASSERARAQDIARRAEECGADLVVMSVDDVRPAARRILARGGAVLAVPPAWRASAGLTRIAVGYDGSEPADAAVEATRALVTVRDGSALRVEIVHVDDSASAGGGVVEKEGVFVVRDGRAHFVPVRVGISGDRYFEILSGLEAGDRVVSGSYEALRDLTDGAPVEVEESAASSEGS